MDTIDESPGRKSGQKNIVDIDHLEKEPRKKKSPGKDLKMRRAAGSATKLMAQALAKMAKNEKDDDSGDCCFGDGESESGPPIPCFCLLQKNKPNIVRRLMVRAAIIKKADVKTFDKSLRDLHEKLGFNLEINDFFRAVDGITVELMAEKGKATKK